MKYFARHFIVFFLMAMLIALPVNFALAEKAKTLEEINRSLQEHETSRLALQQKIKDLDQTLENTSKDLIRITRSIEDNESSLESLNTRITELELKKATLDDKMKTDRLSISRLVLALERIRRTPPEAMIARPETPYETAQSAMLMGDIIPAIDRHAKALQKNLETIEAVTRDLHKEKQEQERLAKSLKSQKQEIEHLLAQRKELYAQTDNDLKAREITIQKISLQAKSLQDLMKKIQEEEKRDEERRRQESEKNLLAKRPPEKKPAPSTSSGNAQLPVSGVILTAYKQKDELGAPSNGLTIQARSGAIVVAPMGGKIQFSGVFKRYGNLIIIEHDNGYHSLVAGLEKIDTVVGQTVNAGEPIGKMPQKSMQTNSKLYYELRKNGNTVNPSEKFANLG